jgi:DNA repair ATPase RecN
MKVTKLTVKNIGIIEDAEINIDKPEIVFFGDIKQGKSTLLNAVRWAFGGSVPMWSKAGR